MSRSVDDFLTDPILFAQQELERAPAFLTDRKKPSGHMRGVEFYPAEVLPRVYAQALRNFLNVHERQPEMASSMPSQDHVFYSKFFRYFPTTPNPAAKHNSIHYLSEPLRVNVLLPKRHVLRRPRDLLSLEPSVGASLFIRPTLGNGDALKISHEEFLRNRPQVYRKVLRRVRRRYGVAWGEWLYGIGAQKILVEEDLSDVMTGFEYQFNCRRGRVRMIRKTENLNIKHLDPESVRQKYFFPDKRPCKGTLKGTGEITDYTFPDTIDLMLQAAQDIASKFDNVRVDFIETTRGVVLGELSCFPGDATFQTLTPELEDLFTDAMSMAD